MWKLKRVWDYFVVYGWKAIFKTSLLMLKTFEDALLDMPFEMLLTQITSVPHKFLVIDSDADEVKQEELAQFDKEMNDLQTPTILLERLKREFDDILKANPKRLY